MCTQISLEHPVLQKKTNINTEQDIEQKVKNFPY